MKFLSLAIIALFTACGPAILFSAHSPDRNHVVEVIAHNRRQYVSVDGKHTAEYSAVASSSLTYSSNGEHMAYAAKRGGHWVVVIDNVDGDEFDGIGEVLIGDDGRTAYVAERAGKWCVVVDGRAGAPFDAILATTLQLASSHVAYVARSGSKVRVVVDGVAGEEFDGVGQLIVGAHVAYAARVGEDAYAVIDGARSKAWTSVERITVDAHHVAYAAFDRDAWRVIVDQEIGPAVATVRAIALGDDHVSYIAHVRDQEGDRDVIVLDGAPIETTDGKFRALTLAPNGPRFIDVAADGEQLIVGTQRETKFDEITTPAFAQGRHAYAARRGNSWFEVIDGAIVPAGSDASTPVFSQDARHVGFVARDARGSYVMIDTVSHHFDLVIADTLAFSDDGTAWAVIAGELARKQMFFVRDRIPSEAVIRTPLSMREVYSAAGKRASLGELSATDDTLATWSRAEANRAAATNANPPTHALRERPERVE